MYVAKPWETPWNMPTMFMHINMTGSAFMFTFRPNSMTFMSETFGRSSVFSGRSFAFLQSRICSHPCIIHLRPRRFIQQPVGLAGFVPFGLRPEHFSISTVFLHKLFVEPGFGYLSVSDHICDVGQPGGAKPVTDEYSGLTS